MHYFYREMDFRETEKPTLILAQTFIDVFPPTHLSNNKQQKIVLIIFVEKNNSIFRVWINTAGSRKIICNW